LEEARQAQLALELLAPERRDLARQPGSLGAARVLGERLGQQDEERVGVAVEDGMAPLLEEAPAALDDLVATPGDRRGELGVAEATPRRAEHPVERVHQDLDRAREGLVPRTLCARPSFGELGDDLGEDRALAREA